MPRNVLARRVLPKLTSRKSNRDIQPKQYKGPRLYNGKRLIQTSQSALWRNNELKEKVRENLTKGTYNEDIWRQHVSQDVADFVDDMEAQGTKLLPEEQFALVSDPVKFFSRPQNVPNILRNQVYFPNFSVTLMKKSQTSPYAVFQSPLWFNKLDMKSYLKTVYNVDVVHVRSQVKGGLLLRRRPTKPRSRGSKFRGPSYKIMTVQLVKPFTWPALDREIDREAFDLKRYQKVAMVQLEESKMEIDPFSSKVDHKQRRSLAEQAQELLQGKKKWQPTWENFPQTRRMILGKQESTPAAESRSQLP